jgi:transcriptional regulator NrdR family protein
VTCPSCKSESRVTETRATAIGMRRRRICQRTECGHRFTTYEVAAPGRTIDDGARLIVVDGTTAAALRLAAHEITELLP